MIGHFAEYYLKTNFVIDCRDCGTRFGSVFVETQCSVSLKLMEALVGLLNIVL